ncbi:hypothetical protein, partial [Neobacillus vireti]|uniref:hypothetical protein n=1 Tax=Neobacillus vireti TaxID=220686 RepID=UPI003000B9EA
ILIQGGVFLRIFIETPNADIDHDLLENQRLTKLLAKHFIEWKFGDMTPGVVYDHCYLINRE